MNAFAHIRLFTHAREAVRAIRSVQSPVLYHNCVSKDLVGVRLAPDFILISLGTLSHELGVYLGRLSTIPTGTLLDHSAGALVFVVLRSSAKQPRDFCGTFRIS